MLRDKKYSSRGLEAFTTVAGLHRSKQRELQYETVLEEQARQFKAGIVDLGEIGRIARNATAASQMWAHVVGMRDEIAAC